MFYGFASGTEVSRSMRARKQGEWEIKEEARPPDILASPKQMLDIGTSVEDVNREGVTGAGTRMGMTTGTKTDTMGTEFGKGTATKPREGGSGPNLRTPRPRRTIVQRQEVSGWPARLEFHLGRRQLQRTSKRCPNLSTRIRLANQKREYTGTRTCISRINNHVGTAI